MPQPAKLYLPALVIVVGILTLLVFIGFSTYWNIDRARNNALDFVHQQGVAIMEAVEAGISAVSHESRNESRAVNELISRTADNRSVAYIYLSLQDSGAFISSPSYEKKRFGRWMPETLSGGIASRFRRLSDSTPVYELAKSVQGAVLVIGLKMSTFENARQEDFHHAIIMVSILGALGAGAVFFIFVIHRYHRMNQALRRTEAYTNQVVESMANGLLSIGPDGRVLSWNTPGLELLGLNHQDPGEIRLDRVLDFEKTGISKTLSEGRPVMDREICFSTPDGDNMPLAVSVTPIGSGDPSAAGAVVILRDLREIKRLEEKVRRSEKFAALGKLAASVAHEIRNPLSSIRGFARFLSHALTDRPAEAEYAEVMVREVDRINRVVTDLLNFARPLVLDPNPENPGDLAEHAVRLVSGDAGSRAIALRLNTRDAPASVVLDANMMAQVMLNLVLNAMEAVESGDFVEVGAAEVPESESMVFWVEDNGPGISSGDLDKIFDPFFTTRAKGTGLGLAIVQKIVESHQGTVRVQSPPEGKSGGCRIEVHIPMTLEQRAEKRGHEAANTDS